jgi:hypothetical protein
MKLELLKDLDRSGNNRYFVECGDYFMCMSHRNIFQIYKFNKLSDDININKHIATYYSVVDAFKEFEKLTKKD